MTEENPLIGGRYRLGKRIGVGGMGRVWLARDEVLRREVAVKEVLLPETPSEDEAYELRQRTLREARAAARLSHPNVVRVYDVMYADNRPWIVMEYVPSRSLAEVIKSDGPMRPDEAAVVGIAVLDALCAAHAAGVLHRDVKPGNVLLADDGRVVLTDFGLATFDEIGSALTQSGIVHGSPQFIAPERALDGTSTVEADMWSLGATLFAAVEGQSPYARSTSYQTLAALATAPPDAPKRAGALKPVLAGLLRRKPSSRMRPDEIRNRLQRVANGESGRARFPRQRHPNPTAAGGLSGDVVPRATAEPKPSAASGSVGGAAIPGRETTTMQPNQPGEGAAPDRAAAVGTETPQPQSIGTPDRNGHLQDDRAYGWNRAAIPDADRDPTGDPAARDAAAGEAVVAAENYNSNGRKIEWRNANGDVVRSSSGTKEELDRPPGRGARRMRRWAVLIAVTAVLLAGGAIVAMRQFGHSAATSRHAATTPGPTHPPGSVSPSGSASSTGIRRLAHVSWPCDPQRPTDSVALPITQTTYKGRAAYPSFTWFMFSKDFPITLPGGFQIAYSPTTACLYDSTSPARMIGIDKWTPSATAATDARVAIRPYQAQARKLKSFHEAGVISVVDGPGKAPSSAKWDYTWLAAIGPLHTFARVYLIDKTAYLISWTTSAANADSDTSVYDNMQASIIIGQMP
jgi:eukaryotic-like serine/threonine-protein kinase